MKETTVSRNYAEALFLAAEAQADGAPERYASLIDAVSAAIHADSRIAIAFESPRVSKAIKAKLISESLTGVAPAEFVRFLQSVVRRGRQGLLGGIALEYHGLLDEKRNRVRADVTLAVEADVKLQQQITERLGTVLGREVRPQFRVDKGILGGMVVRVGDRIFDGSLRRRLAALRRRMLTGE